MSQSPIRTEQNETERGGLPMVLPENGGDLHDGWLSRVMRILFGWRAQATRAELELVLTAEQAESGFSPTEAAMLKNILGLRECRIESVMVPRADIVAVQQDITIGELVKVFAGAAHSRLVVYNDTLDDPAIRVLNCDWRSVDAPTNVLSFPAPRAGGDRPFIGDIVLAYETIAAEAQAEHKPFAHHFAHLCIHGFLHLLGYDHLRKKDAELMEGAEQDILRRLGIPDPYR